MTGCVGWVGEPDCLAGRGPGASPGGQGALGRVSCTVSPLPLLAPLRLPPCSGRPAGRALSAPARPPRRPCAAVSIRWGPCCRPARVWPRFSGVRACPDGQAPAMSPPPRHSPWGQPEHRHSGQATPLGWGRGAGPGLTEASGGVRPRVRPWGTSSAGGGRVFTQNAHVQLQVTRGHGAIREGRLALGLLRGHLPAGGPGGGPVGRCGRQSWWA